MLADPGHAFKYGTSVRVSAERDVFLEDVEGLGDRLLRSPDRASRGRNAATAWQAADADGRRRDLAGRSRAGPGLAV